MCAFRNLFEIMNEHSFDSARTLPFFEAFTVFRIPEKATSGKFSGFTLTELVLVIAIVAILATIGFLALS